MGLSSLAWGVNSGSGSSSGFQPDNNLFLKPIENRQRGMLPVQLQLIE